MSRTRIVGGKMTIKVGGNYTINALEGNITTIAAGQNIEVAKQGTINYGNFTAPEEKNNIAKVEESYWYDGKDITTKTTNLLYKKNHKVFIYIKFNEHAIGKKCEISIHSNATEVNKYEFTILHLETQYSFNVTGSKFQIPNKDKINLSYKIKLQGKTKLFCNTEGTSLKVHLVRYIPAIMKQKKWNKGFEMQEKWFTNKANSNPNKNVDIANIITMQWLLNFTRVKLFYQEIVTKKLWFTKAAQNQIISEVKKMAITYPKRIPEVTRIGEKSSQITHDKNGNPIPKFDKYYFTNIVFKSSYFSELDDLYAALANFAFRVCIVDAEIINTNIPNIYQLKINKIGIYIKDSFDYIDQGIFSQSLGYWSIKNQDVSKLVLIDNSYHLIKNKHFQDYRKDTGFGMDFKVFSDLKIVNVNEKIKFQHIF